jgi:hypothetical protein
MNQLLQQAAVFLAWALNTVLGFWVMVVVRHSFMAALAVLYVGDSIRRAWVTRFWGQAYFAVAGLIYLIFIFFIDGYFKDGLAERDLFRRFSRIAGILLLMLFVADLVTSLIQRTMFGRLSLILLPVEGVVGTTLLIYSFYARTLRGKPSARHR